MTDIVQKLKQSYHLDTVQPEHPVLRAVREIERLRESEQKFMQLAAEARRDADALRRDGACPHIVSTAEGTHHCALATAPRFAHTYCSQCGSDLGPGDSGVSHCADHRKAALDAAPQAEQDQAAQVPREVAATLTTTDIAWLETRRLTKLWRELGQIKWAGADEGWDRAIEAVRSWLNDECQKVLDWKAAADQSNKTAIELLQKMQGLKHD